MDRYMIDLGGIDGVVGDRKFDHQIYDGSYDIDTDSNVSTFERFSKNRWKRSRRAEILGKDGLRHLHFKCFLERDFWVRVQQD